MCKPEKAMSELMKKASKEATKKGVQDKMWVKGNLISQKREVSTDEYMRGNLLLNEVKAEDVAKAFFHLAVSKKTTGAVLTVDGGNIAASLR